MEKIYILLDVGGTQIKAAWAAETGEIKSQIFNFPAHARENKEEIFRNFSEIICKVMSCRENAEVQAVGMAFPGPFDYERGISFMKGLDKYDSIYGIAIEKEIKTRLQQLEKSRFVFLHDIEAFALGESCYGKAVNEEKLLCLCIGTGAGSAFVKNRRIVIGGEDGVPKNGWIFSVPYRNSIIDDYLSVRGLEKICIEIMGEPLTGKELYRLCLEDNESARSVYRKFGKTLAECILPFIETFHPNAVVLGGQISKSFLYFGNEFQKACSQRNVRIYLEDDTSARAMQGLIIKIMRGE